MPANCVVHCKEHTTLLLCYFVQYCVPLLMALQSSDLYFVIQNDNLPPEKECTSWQSSMWGKQEKQEINVTLPMKLTVPLCCWLTYTYECINGVNQRCPCAFLCKYIPIFCCITSLYCMSDVLYSIVYTLQLSDEYFLVQL